MSLISGHPLKHRRAKIRHFSWLMDKNSSFARLDDLPRFLDARAVLSWLCSVRCPSSCPWHSNTYVLPRGYLGTHISGDDLLTIIEISGRTFLSPRVPNSVKVHHQSRNTC